VTQDAPVIEETIDAVRSVVREALDRASADADRTWAALASAGLLALPVPEAQDGEGLGLREVAVVLREVGARAVQLPAWETLCCGVLTLAAAGSAAQRELLREVATGALVLTPALREVGVGIPDRPGTTYVDGRLDGRKIGVTYADRAGRLLVTASEDGRPVVALVDPQGPAPASTPWSSTARPPSCFRAPTRRDCSATWRSPACA
jgi:alkylation response protein AidB-like acyl-CoA dehydrogenase